MAYRYAVLWLVLANAIVFIFQTIYPTITNQFSLVSANVLSQPWTLITSMFLHGGIDHILFNMIALALFGFILERIIGSKRFLIVYFISGIIAGVVSTFFYTASIGASGAIFGVMGALGVLRPRMVVYVSYVPMPMALAVVVWIILNFGGLLFPGEVAYAAHIGGLASGLIYGFYLRKDFKENYAKKRSEHMSDKEIYNWENRYIRQ